VSGRGKLASYIANEIGRLQIRMASEQSTDELRALALLICQDGDAPGSPPRCAEPCHWCLNEARRELEEQTDAE